MSRVLVVGAGLTGSLCAALLRKEITAPLYLALWDKAGDIGAEVSLKHCVTQIHLKIGVPWSCRYLSSHPCICFISIDNKKRNIESSECGPSVVIQTTVPFGVQHLEASEADVQKLMIQQLETILPGLPQPVATICHKWTYSQVTSSVSDRPGQMTLHLKPFLVCGGDGFTHSNFNGCISSALSVMKVLKRYI